MPTVNDNTDEDDGTVTVFVNDGPGYNAGQGALVTVRDNDDPIPAAFFRSASSSAVEDDGTHVVQVDLNRPAPAGGLTLRYSVSGTATAGSGNDFTIQNSGTLSIAAGGASATIPVAINDDSGIENAETVILTLTGGTGYTVDSPGVHTLTIADNDSTSAQPSVSFDSASSSAAEDDGTHNVTVNISPAPAGSFTLGYSVGGTATAGSGNDFTIQNSGMVAVTAGATTATIPVAINDDSSIENAETVILTLTGGTGYTLGTTTVHTLTITANDQLPPITAASLFSGAGTTLPEGAGTFFNATFSFSRQLHGTDMVTLPLSIGGTATLGRDYRLTCGPGSNGVVITCNNLDGNSPSITFDGSGLGESIIRIVRSVLNLETLEDNTSESDETVTLSLGTRSRTLTIKITDAPSSVELSFFNATYEVNEDALILKPIFEMSRASGSDITVPLIFTDITATGGADYTRVSQGILEADGITRHSIDIPILDDTVYEGDETFKVAIDTANLPAGVTAGSITEATVTIVENDAPDTTAPQVTSITRQSPSSSPTNADSLTWRVTFDEPVQNVDAADFQVSGTTALITGVSPVTGTNTYDVSTSGGDLANLDATVTLSFNSSHDIQDTSGNPLDSNPTLTGTDNSFVVQNTITPPPGRPGLVISKNGLSVTEGGTGSYMVSLATEPTGTVTVTIASDNTDVTVSPASLTFHASGGSRPWNTAQTVTVSAEQDAAADDDSVTLSHTATGGGYGSVTTALVTVTVDDDETPQPVASFAAASSSAAEDGGTHNVTVNLTQAAPSSGLTLAYSVTGTATEGSGNDFTIQNYGTVAVVAGGTTATIPVVINDDSTDENAETVILTLTGGTGYRLGSTTVHTLTITDNDNPPPGTPGLVILKNTLSVTEGGTDSYMVRLATEPTGTVTVTIASNNTDVTVSPASLTFHASGGSRPWNTAQTVTVSAERDADADNDSATLIHTATGGGYGSVAAASVTVTVDDDGTTPTPPPTTPTPVVSISAGAPSVTEGDAISFTLSATPPPEAGATITVNTTWPRMAVLPPVARPVAGRWPSAPAAWPASPSPPMMTPSMNPTAASRPPCKRERAIGPTPAML